MPSMVGCHAIDVNEMRTNLKVFIYKLVRSSSTWMFKSLRRSYKTSRTFHTLQESAKFCMRRKSGAVPSRYRWNATHCDRMPFWFQRVGIGNDTLTAPLCNDGCKTQLFLSVF